FATMTGIPKMQHHERSVISPRQANRMPAREPHRSLPEHEHPFGPGYGGVTGVWRRPSPTYRLGYAALAARAAPRSLLASSRDRAAPDDTVMNPIRVALRYPWSVVVGVIALAFGAWFAARHMSRDIFPDLGVPIIYVAQPYGGMDPAQMEGFLVNYYEYH